MPAVPCSRRPSSRSPSQVSWVCRVRVGVSQSFRFLSVFSFPHGGQQCSDSCSVRVYTQVASPLPRTVCGAPNCVLATHLVARPGERGRLVTLPGSAGSAWHTITSPICPWPLAHSPKPNATSKRDLDAEWSSDRDQHRPRPRLHEPLPPSHFPFLRCLDE